MPQASLKAPKTLFGQRCHFEARQNSIYLRIAPGF